MDTTLQAPSISAPASVEIERVTRRFGAVTALEGLSLRADEHEVVCVVGPSGCGKSTLLELVCGLQAPDAGTVAGPPAVYMPQRDLLLPWWGALDNAALPLRVAGQSRAAARAQAQPLFAELGLAGFERARPDALSGGMRQRVAFLRTLLSGKPVLALDEPFAALDALTRAEVQRWLEQALARAPRTVLLVTHDVEEAVVLGDRVVVLSPRPGRVVAELASELPRPRRRTDPAVGALRERALAAMGVPA
jgi:ABC-type nitrate/sulfonate/bicarbonate transport system ATPase subunit